MATLLVPTHVESVLIYSSNAAVKLCFGKNSTKTNNTEKQKRSVGSWQIERSPNEMILIVF